MKRALLASLLLLVAGCGDDGDDDSADDNKPLPTTTTPTDTEPTGTPTTETPAPKPDGTRITVGDSEFGPMLFDARGQAIYLFDQETSTTPTCYGACAEAWPPVLTDGVPVAGKGVRAGLVGTTNRRDGSHQVTYGGHPLYYYAHEGPGEVECHDVFLNGGYWYVVQPDGSRAP